MKTPVLYYFLAMTAATFVPLIAHGQYKVPDGSEVPPSVSAQGSVSSAVADGGGSVQGAVEIKGQKKEDPAAVKERKNASGFGYAGAHGQFGSRVPIGVAPSIGVTNSAMDVNATVSLNAAPDIFRTDLTFQGLRAGTGSPYGLEDGTEYGVMFDGHMGIGVGSDNNHGTAGTGVMNTAITAGPIVPFTAGFCPTGVLRGGIGVGGTFGNQIGSGHQYDPGFTTAAFGPAAAVGMGCQWQNIVASVSPYLIANSDRWIPEDHNPTTFTGGLNGMVSWKFSKNVAAMARINSDMAVVNDHDQNKGLLQTTVFGIGAYGTFSEEKPPVASRIHVADDAPTAAPGQK